MGRHHTKSRTKSRHARRDLITVTGSGSASAVPDVVHVSIGLRVSGDDVSSALGGLGERLDATRAVIVAQGLAARDIASTGAGVQPRYDRDGVNITGYTAYHQLGLVVRDVDQVGSLIGACAESAGNSLTVDSISLAISDNAPLERQARDAAFAHARDKAEQLAAAGGRSLGGVVDIQEGGRAATPVGGARYRMAMASDEAMSVSAGEHSVTASVTVSWQLA